MMKILMMWWWWWCTRFKLNFYFPQNNLRTWTHLLLPVYDLGQTWCCDALGFQYYWERHLIVPEWYNRILEYTRKYGKNNVFQYKLHENVIQYCLVVDFRYLIANLTSWEFLKWPKTGYFWICFSVLGHYALTTLKVVESGSRWLRITKSNW